MKSNYGPSGSTPTIAFQSASDPRPPSSPPARRKRSPSFAPFMLHPLRPTHGCDGRLCRQDVVPSLARSGSPPRRWRSQAGARPGFRGRRAPSHTGPRPDASPAAHAGPREWTASCSALHSPGGQTGIKALASRARKAVANTPQGDGVDQAQVSKRGAGRTSARISSSVSRRFSISPRHTPGRSIEAGIANCGRHP